MKLSTVATFGLASLAAASPVFNKDNSDAVNKREEDSQNLDKRFWGWPPFNPFNPFAPFPTTTSTSTKAKPKPTPAPSSSPSWPKFNNGTVTSSSSHVITTTSIPSSSSKPPASKTTPTPSQPTSNKPSPTSPEGIVSSIVSDVNGLVNGIWQDINGIIGSIGQDIGSIFGGDDDNDGFPFFKRELEAALKKRDLEGDISKGTATAEEIEAALGQLVTNVFGHLISLTNGTSVSLAQSLLTALDL